MITPRHFAVLGSPLLLAVAASAFAYSDLEYCVGRPMFDAVFEQTAELLPTIDLTSSVRASVTAAQERSRSEQLAHEQARQQSRERRESESAAVTQTYSVSDEDAKALTIIVASPQKRGAPAADGLIAQAAKIAVEGAAVETARLIATGAGAEAARRAGQIKGLSLAKTALSRVGANLSPADEQRLAQRVSGDIAAAVAPVGVAPWSQTTSRRIAQTRAAERSNRSEQSSGESQTTATRNSQNEQTSSSLAEQRAIERALSVPIRIDWHRDVLNAFYPGRMSMPNGGQPFRIASISCPNVANVLAAATYSGLRYATSRDPTLVNVMQKLHSIGRTGNLFLFASGVTTILDDDDPAAKAAALSVLYGLGSTELSGRLGAVSETLFQQHVLAAIQRQYEVLDELVQKDLRAKGRQLGRELPEQMPALGAPPHNTAMAPTPPEKMMYLIAQTARNEYRIMKRNLE